MKSGEFLEEILLGESIAGVWIVEDFNNAEGDVRALGTEAEAVSESKYEVFREEDERTLALEWRVEYISSTNGKCFVAIFTGPEAQARAEEYAKWKNGE